MDVAHHGGNVGEDVAVLALQDVAGAVGGDQIGVVDESFAHRGDRSYGAVEAELFGDSFHALFVFGSDAGKSSRRRIFDSV